MCVFFSSFLISSHILMMHELLSGSFFFTTRTNFLFFFFFLTKIFMSDEWISLFKKLKTNFFLNCTYSLAILIGAHFDKINSTSDRLNFNTKFWMRRFFVFWKINTCDTNDIQYWSMIQLILHFKKKTFFFYLSPSFSLKIIRESKSSQMEFSYGLSIHIHKNQPKKKKIGFKLKSPKNFWISEF